MVEGHEASHRQVAPGVVVPVEEGQLLRAVRRVIGRVQIDRQVFAAPPEAPAMPLDHTVGECLTHPIQLRAPRCILKARERGLGRQRRPRDRIAIEQELVDRVLGKPRRISPVGVPAGDPVEPLAQQVPHRVLDLAALAPIYQTPGQPPTQIQPGIAGLQQDRPAVGTAVPFVKLSHQRLAKKIGKQHRLSCGIVAHAKASRVTEVLVVKPFLSQKGLLHFTDSRVFANCSG